MLMTLPPHPSIGQPLSPEPLSPEPLSPEPLSPEVAAVLAKHKIELEFNALENPSVEAIKALAEHDSGLSFPKITELTPAIAKALAGSQGQRLSLGGLTSLSPS